jgi:hypothetical protein
MVREDGPPKRQRPSFGTAQGAPRLFSAVGGRKGIGPRHGRHARSHSNGSTDHADGSSIGTGRPLRIAATRSSITTRWRSSLTRPIADLRRRGPRRLRGRSAHVVRPRRARPVDPRPSMIPTRPGGFGHRERCRDDADRGTLDVEEGMRIAGQPHPSPSDAPLGRIQGRPGCPTRRYARHPRPEPVWSDPGSGRSNRRRSSRKAGGSMRDTE